MDDLSWRARLAKSNINILNFSWGDDRTVVEIFYEFMYHPKVGQTKWCKTWTSVAGEISSDDVQMAVSGDKIADELRREVLALRRELEG